VDRLAFSPDGRLLAASRSDTATPSNHEQLELWDVGSGELRQTLTPHEGGIYAVVFSPDGRTLVTSGTDQVLRFWRVGTLAPAAR
jgi:WD40 repeat protein